MKGAKAGHEGPSGGSLEPREGVLDSILDRGLEERLDGLLRRGVRIVDPRQTYIGPEVDLQRICRGAILHPGARICGARSFLGPEAEVGTEGPATIVDGIFGERARIASGYVRGAVLLRDASLGGSAHVRGGTILEEEASTAHAVGLKQTILLAFVTLGSLINFCDVLMAGGTSRRDHSEVGSGYIHFNFTPWGARGDKATPSLVGDVQRGVLLRERRIFLGGSGGMIGPRKVGYGAIVGAGSVLRSDVQEGHLAIQRGRAIDRDFAADYLDGMEPRCARNLRYIGELVALRAWYRQVRRPRAPAGEAGAHLRIVLDGAIENLDLAIAEREKRVRDFAAERGASIVGLGAADEVAPCPLDLSAGGERSSDHIAWVRGLRESEVEALRRWLEAIVTGAVERRTIGA